MTIQTNINVEDIFYNEAKEVFQNLGLSFGEAINIFLAKVANEKSIPFDLRLPSQELEDRVKNIDNNINIQTYKTSDSLFEELGI